MEPSKPGSNAVTLPQEKRAWTFAGLLAIVVAQSAHAAPASKARTEQEIKATVASIVAGINAHDLDRATRFDSDDIVSMESGRPPTHGLAQEREGLARAFQYAPSWRLALVDETVDVADSGEMAVYRSTYDEESLQDGIPMTHRVNFIAEFKRQPDGAFKVIWSVVSSIEKSHRK